jgi:hypothetical protein
MSSTLLAATYWRTENKDNRKVKFVWKNQDSSREISLEIYHYADRKCFSASVTRANISKTDTGFSVREYAPFTDIMQLGKLPIARFSMAKLSEYADSVMLDFINSVDNEFRQEAFQLALTNHRQQ